MDSQQPDDTATNRQVRITPVFRQGKIFAELRFVSIPPCPAKILGIGELETLIEDAQRIVSQMRWQYARYYVATESVSMEHDTRHLVLRDIVEHPIDGMRAICGRELHHPQERWAFSPLAYDITTVYNLCRTCEHLYRARERHT